MSTLDAVVKPDEREPLSLIFDPGNTRERRLALSVGGHEWRDGKVHYPPEPMVVRDLRAVMDPQPELTDAAKFWFYEYMHKARMSIEIGSQPDLPMEPTDRYFALLQRLYPYQRVGTAWLNYVGRGILGDEPGLGKTPQTMVAAASASRVLVVTLNAVKQHWRRHIADWLGKPVAVAEGSHAQRQASIDERADWTIINHEMLRPGVNGYSRLISEQWDAVIFDEAHKFQGRPPSKVKKTGSQQSLGAGMLKTDALYMATGSPIWNRPESIWHLLHLLEPRRWSSFWRFVDEYCEQEVTPFSTNIVGIKPTERERFKSVLAPLLLVRKKVDVAPWLPPKIYETVEYSLTKQQRAQYTEMKRRLRRLDQSGQILETYAVTPMAAMRRLINMPHVMDVPGGSPKQSILEEIVRNLVDESGKKIIIFCWHKDYAAYLHMCFAKSVLITGDTPNRDQAVQDFRFGSTPILVATIGAVGTGLDLIEATACIFAEGAYVPTLNTQAEDRLHRIGTVVSPVIYRLAAVKTVEQVIWEVSDDRKDIADDLTATREIVRRVLSGAD